MVKAVIINAVYPPEPVVSAQMGQDLALYLAENGAKVTVLCPFPTRPMGAQYSDYTNRDSVRLDLDAGVEVVRLPSFTAPHSRLLRRMRESSSFGKHACRHLERHLADVDVVYANAWPLFSQSLIARHCARQGIPLVLHIQDIYPESLLGKLPGFVGGMVTTPLTVLDRWIARQATKVVVISENMRRAYVDGRGLGEDKVITIQNWVDEGRFGSEPSRKIACERYGVPEDRFTFLYLGNIGPVAGVDGLIEAFHTAQLKHAQLVIAGDGSSKKACEELVKRTGVTDVRFISDPAVENVALIQSLGHVCLLPLRRGAAMSSIPSKLMAYLFSQRPVLATVDAESDTARCIRDANCGWVGEPEDVSWLAAKMAEVAAMPEGALNTLGQQGRAYGHRHFSKAEGVKKLGAVVLGAVGSKERLIVQNPLRGSI